MVELKKRVNALMDESRESLEVHHRAVAYLEAKMADTMDRIPSVDNQELLEQLKEENEGLQQ